jgi:hypothetical protein
MTEFHPEDGAAGFSETLVNFYQTSRQHIPEDRSENPESLADSRFID